jgi:monofunctional chorismate mutase
MNADLDRLRNQIQEIDHQIAKLLHKRIDTVLEIGQIKSELGLPIVDKNREKQVITNVLNDSNNPVHTKSIHKFFRYIIRICRETQKNAITKDRKER